MRAERERVSEVKFFFFILPPSPINQLYTFLPRLSDSLDSEYYVNEGEEGERETEMYVMCEKVFLRFDYEFGLGDILCSPCTYQLAEHSQHNCSRVILILC
jgi:hypothetical protein